MKPPKIVTRGSRQISELNDLIEIIRVPQQPSRPEPPSPTYLNDSNPLHMLRELVAQIEALVNLGEEETQIHEELPPEQLHTFQTPSAEIEKYIELVQKQNAVLRRITPKVN